MFDKIIGNENVKKHLESALENKSIAHSYMFIGKAGIGKKLFAQEYAKNIMCVKGKNCRGTCSSCIKLQANSNPDFYQIEKDGNTIKIKQIREMQEKIYEKPIISSKKVYIINDAESMTEESQNCLLKTLEEPPKYAVIILIVSNESKLLSTIKSRCIKIQFSDLSIEELKKQLPNESDEVIELLEGSFESIDKISEKKEDFNELKKIINNIQNQKKVEVLNNAELLYTKKDDIINLLNLMNIILFKEKMLNAIPIVENTKKKLLSNNNYDMCIDNMLISIMDKN